MKENLKMTKTNFAIKREQSNLFELPSVSKVLCKKMPICLYLSKKSTYFVPVLPIMREDRRIKNH